MLSAFLFWLSMAWGFVVLLSYFANFLKGNSGLEFRPHPFVAWLLFAGMATLAKFFGH